MTDRHYLSRAIVRVENLLACALFQSDEETRFYLKGTHIAPHPGRDGAVLSASNGHVALMVHEAEGHASGLPAIWAVDKRRLNPLVTQLRRTHTWAKKMPVWCELARTDDTAVSLSLHACNTAAEVLDGSALPLHQQQDKALWIDGSFPEVVQVMGKIPMPLRVVSPKNSGKTSKPVFEPPPALAARYLRLIGELAAVYGEKGSFSTPGPAATVYSAGRGSPCRVVLDEHPEIVCVIMPMRSAHEALDPDMLEPGWFQELRGETPPPKVEEPEPEVAEAA